MSHIYTRFLWLAFGAGLGAFQLWFGASTHQVGSALSGVGLILFGAVGFLHPVLLATPIRRSTLTSTATAVGPPHVRAVLTGAAFLCLIVGLVLRYAFKV
jgi:hypothetical protein